MIDKINIESRIGGPNKLNAKALIYFENGDGWRENLGLYVVWFFSSSPEDFGTRVNQIVDITKDIAKIIKDKHQNKFDSKIKKEINERWKANPNDGKFYTSFEIKQKAVY